MKKTILAAMLVLSLSVPSLALNHSSQTMKCITSGDLLVVGDSIIKLVECMGEPAYKNARSVTNYGKSGKVETPVEEWFYKVDGWTYKITVKGGAVIGITDMGRD